MTSQKLTQGRNISALHKYLDLDQKGKVQAEYVWIDPNGSLRSKTKTLDKKVTSLKDLPEWNFDGSSTGQAPGNDSEVWIRPVKYVPDPFRRGDNIIVLTECFDAYWKPIPTNKRAVARPVFEKVKEHVTWYGMEQEYTLFEKDGQTPLGWPQFGFPAPQGQYYCSVGTRNAYGRHVVEAHYRACLYAGITISGINAEVMPGQWEFQVGPVEGIDAGDQMWIARYILQRVCEDFEVSASFEPKPVKGDWNGAGCHTNFSTKPMREEGGIKVIEEAMNKLARKHKEHMDLYGKGNQDRMTGKHETASYDKFTFGVADRGASCRIPRLTTRAGKGYFEDRRPAANCDPYLVTSKIAETVCLDE